MTSQTIEAYRAILAGRSAAELRQLAHIKRFMERLVADPRFRARLADCGGDYRSVAEAYGIDVDPQEMLPLFSVRHMRYRYTDEEGRWPLSKAWSDYMQEMVAHRDLLRESGETAEANPRFDAWRRRQIARSMSELGASGPAITHPLVAYELSKGCTVGCWFCGLSAERFAGHLAYTPESAALWRGVLETMTALFGPAAQTGFCYWATDPMDNPDYDKFIRDHLLITGYLPQTTTAAPLKDVALTRRVLDLFARHGCITNRFSILNLKLLDKVHAAFPPEELMGVEIVTQNREALTSKADVGRARAHRERLRAAGRPDRIAERDDDHSTIACVSGFLVNMVERSVQMVSPTRGGARWPLGYRVYETVRFADAAGFRAAVEGMVARHAGGELRGRDVLAFRPDLAYRELADGFELANRSASHRYRGPAFARALGGLVAEGRHSAGEIHAALAAQGADIFLVADALRELFAMGVLDDDPASGLIGAPAEARRVAV